jgi:Fe-S-cluster containining protein
MSDNSLPGASVDDVIRGLVYTHNRANANTAELHQAAAAVQAMVELLVERGVLDRETVDARQREAAEKLRGDYLERGMGVAMQEFGVGKYQFHGTAEIDCGARIPLCKAACCRLPFALSKQDVQEGIIHWDLGRPYMIAQGRDGYCVHMDRGNCHCTVYAQRPIPCRGYDCRDDQRIWLDFENRIVNPRIEEPDWPACLEAEDAQGVGEEG